MRSLPPGVGLATIAALALLACPPSVEPAEVVAPRSEEQQSLATARARVSDASVGFGAMRAYGANTHDPLERATTATGIVLDAKGAPIAQAVILATSMDLSTSETLRGRSTSVGKFVLKHLAAGTYCFEARRQGYVGTPVVT